METGRRQRSGKPHGRQSKAVVQGREENRFSVFISPHCCCPADDTWQFGGTLEKKMHEIGMFQRSGPLSVVCFAADWLERFCATCSSTASRWRRSRALPCAPAPVTHANSTQDDAIKKSTDAAATLTTVVKHNRKLITQVSLHLCAPPNRASRHMTLG